MAGRTTHLIEFECHHTREFVQPTPKIGEVLWCFRCAESVRVIEAPAEYKLRCDDCSYSKPFGVARLNAEIAAAKHRMRHPGHTVKIFNGAKLVHSFADRYQTAIPMMQESDQIPPF